MRLNSYREKSCDVSPSHQHDVSNSERRDEGIHAKNVEKQFKVILAEHVMKEKDRLPNYEVKKINGKFVCVLTVFDELYKSPFGENTMQDAEESAAREACKALRLTETTPEYMPR